MTKYFMAGNVWLVVALVLFLGKNIAGTGSELCSLLGIGRPIDPVLYDLITLACAGIGVTFIIGLPVFRRFDAKVSAFRDKSEE